MEPGHEELYLWGEKCSGFNGEPLKTSEIRGNTISSISSYQNCSILDQMEAFQRMFVTAR